VSWLVAVQKSVTTDTPATAHSSHLAAPAVGANPAGKSTKLAMAQANARTLRRAHHAPWREEPAVKWITVGTALAACAIAFPAALAAGTPVAHAKNGDTHVTGQGIQQTLDCNDSTLLVDGTSNTVNAKGTCWAVTMMGSGNTVIADTVVNDITVYGWDQTVYFHNGDPFIRDRGRELAMVNRIDRVPA
jgi:hypothetical protein